MGRNIKKKNVTYKAAYNNDIGKKRKYNEDRLLFLPEYQFFSVADGMGGLEFGEETAEMVCDSMRNLVPKIEKEHNKAVGEQLKKNLENISRYIRKKGNTEERIKYGTTFSGVMIQECKTIWINIGDSRGYVISKNKKKITQVTIDHNLAQLAVEEGYLKPEQKDSSGLSSKLTRFIGMKDEVNVDYFERTIAVGESILLCTDGLYGMLSERDICNCIKNHKSPERVCRDLINKANKKGGKDNISVVYIKKGD